MRFHLILYRWPPATHCYSCNCVNTPIIHKRSSDPADETHETTERRTENVPVNGPAQPTGINLLLRVITSSTAHLGPPQKNETSRNMSEIHARMKETDKSTRKLCQIYSVSDWAINLM